jgi:metallophosphoesterase (TIGR03767 family)
MTEDASDRRAVGAATTLEVALVPGEPGAGGYRRLHATEGDPLVVRTDLGGTAPSQRLRSLLAFVHLSDLHVTDVQSPARAEFLDRFGDPDSPLAAALGRVGTYRAQEALTFHVVDAMARAVRRLPGAPGTGAPLAFAVSTGDATDNCQENELDAYVALLEGGREVVPDSGDTGRYEGVGAADAYDVRYWHPDGTPDGEEADLPRGARGFPEVPGLLDACRRPFTAAGLGLPWYAVYGNHDSLFGGTLAPLGELGARATGAEKTTLLDSGTDVLGLLADNETSPSAGDWGLLEGTVRKVTPDPRRRPVTTSEWIQAHLGPDGSPSGHGLDEEAAEAGRAYYGFDAGIVRCLVLDTVNRAGGWQGSISTEQLDWLETELVGGHSRYAGRDGEDVTTGNADRLFVLFSHHTLATLINDYSPDGARRHLGPEVEHLLARFANVVAWVNGHTHANAIIALPAARGGGCWQITTASHIDWPQQARVVELAVDEESGDLAVVTAVLDHAGAVDPRTAPEGEVTTLAGWSRELAVNAWQGRLADGAEPARGAPGHEEPVGRGRRADRNVALVVPAPFPLLAVLTPTAGGEDSGQVSRSAPPPADGAGRTPRS